MIRSFNDYPPWLTMYVTWFLLKIHMCSVDRQWCHRERPLRRPLRWKMSGKCIYFSVVKHFFLVIMTIYIFKSKNKVCPIENNTNLDSIFYLVKVQKLLLFFYLHLTWLLAHDITKEFWKNSHFENMRAVFLLSCQNSLRWEKSLICHWNIDSWRQKLSFGCVMVPKNNQNII